MIKRNSQILCIWFLVCDLLVTALAWLGAYYFRFESGWIPLHHTPLDFSLCLRQLPLVLIVSAIAYRLTGQYVIHRFRRLREEVVSVCKGTTLMVLLVVASMFGMQDPYESRATLLLFFGLTG